MASQTLTQQLSSVHVPTQREISAQKISQVLDREVTPEDLLDDYNYELEGARLDCVIRPVHYKGGRYQFGNGDRKFINEGNLWEVKNLTELKDKMQKEDELARDSFKRKYLNFFNLKTLGLLGGLAVALFVGWFMLGLAGLFSANLAMSEMATVALMLPAVLYMMGVLLCESFASRGLDLTDEAWPIK
jgi:hypothetical protein